MEDRTIIQWDKDYLDALGLLKVDVLALGMLSCIRRALELFQLRHGKRLTMADIPHDDPAVYEMICKADTIGVFRSNRARRWRCAAPGRRIITIW